jgi:hypothetical protein
MKYGYLPYEVAGNRYIKSSLNLPQEVLKIYFTGPGAQERDRGWIGVYSGFAGFSKLTVENGVARLYLTGNCQSNGATYTIAGPLIANLKQFDYIKVVKIYDQNGSTENPTDAGDSIPACLQP